jgi:hypothetical protein
MRFFDLRRFVRLAIGFPGETCKLWRSQPNWIKEFLCRTPEQIEREANSRQPVAASRILCGSSVISTYIYNSCFIYYHCWGHFDYRSKYCKAPHWKSIIYISPFPSPVTVCRNQVHLMSVVRLQIRFPFFSLPLFPYSLNFLQPIIKRSPNVELH